MSTIMDDPRVDEYREALADVNQGLSGPSGAHERYRQSLLPYVEHMAEHIDGLLAAGQTHPQMRRIMMRSLFNNGLPLGPIALGFKATEEEMAYVSKDPPIQMQPVDEIDRLQRLPYAAYLGTTYWKGIRSDALKRAENRCQLCGSPKSLQVHHRTYERRGYERPADVIVLCDTCHSRHHGHLRVA